MTDIFDIEVPKTEIKISKSQFVKGDIVYYGEDNKYPNKMEDLINASETAKSCVNTYSKFIFTEFADENIGDTVVGRTKTNKKYTLNAFARDLAKSYAKFNGAYIQVSKNLEGKVVEVSVLDFTKCRFSAFDDLGHSNYIYVGDWASTVKNFSKGTKKHFFRFPTFSDNFEVFKNYATELKTTTSVYHSFLDEQYVYPCNQFETVAYDMATEMEVQINRYEEITQGSTAKLVIRTDFSKDPEKQREQVERIKNFVGSKGDRVLVIRTAFDESGQPMNNGYQLDTIPDTRDISAFENAETSVANNIRKVISIPACLIDYNHGANIEVSGAQMKSATIYFNELCKDARMVLEHTLNELFDNTTIEFGTKNFEIKDKNISNYDTDSREA